MKRKLIAAMALLLLTVAFHHVFAEVNHWSVMGLVAIEITELVFSS
ncbi:hypothetical protein [Parashewanella tropica]|nr:hypothetical protein [Parashewanella tropica]